jgi:hypothetical protein
VTFVVTHGTGDLDGYEGRVTDIAREEGGPQGDRDFGSHPPAHRHHRCRDAPARSRQCNGCSARQPGDDAHRRRRRGCGRRDAPRALTVLAEPFLPGRRHAGSAPPKDGYFGFNSSLTRLGIGCERPESGNDGQ